MPLFIIFSLIGIMLIVFGAVIRFKKAYMIISGINTSTPERRAKMDLGAICTVVGNTLMIGGFMWIVAGLCYMLGFEMVLIVMIPVFTIWVLAAFGYIQRYDHNNKDVNGKIKKGAKAVFIIVGIISLAVFVFIGKIMFSGTGAPIITIEGNTMSIDSSFGCEIIREHIISVTLVDTVPSLYRTNGYGMGVYLKGAVSNNKLGAGRAYIKTDNPPFIFITLDDSNGKFLYLNLYNKKQTEELYSQINTWIE